jgi:hypothetical protein
VSPDSPISYDDRARYPPVTPERQAWAGATSGAAAVARGHLLGCRDIGGQDARCSAVTVVPIVVFDEQVSLDRHNVERHSEHACFGMGSQLLDHFQRSERIGTSERTKVQRSRLSCATCGNARVSPRVGMPTGAFRSARIASARPAQTGPSLPQPMQRARRPV